MGLGGIGNFLASLFMKKICSYETRTLSFVYNRHLWDVKKKTIDKLGYPDAEKAGCIIALSLNSAVGYKYGLTSPNLV